MKHMVPKRAQAMWVEGEVAPRRYVCLALHSFSAFDLTAAIEALKDANLRQGVETYSWRLLSPDSKRVTSSSGLAIDVDAGLESLGRGDVLVVLNGDDFVSSSTAQVLTWLQIQSRRVDRIGAIGSGVYTLLKAKAIPRTEVTTHWKYHSGMQETFPEPQFRRSIFCVSGPTFTCAGGLGTVDLMLHLITSDHGGDLATWVSDNLVCSTPRTLAYEQTFSQCTRLEGRNRTVANAIQIMQDTLEFPIPPSQIASKLSISIRQLERLFARYVHSTPKSYYMKLRMEHARRLLLQTNLSVIEVGIAAGCNSASHFSKIYRKHFGTAPYRERGLSNAGQS